MLEGLDPSTIIAICALVTALGFIFNMLLGPLKEKQIHFEADLKELQKGQALLAGKVDLLAGKIDLLLRSKDKKKTE